MNHTAGLLLPFLAASAVASDLRVEVPTAIAPGTGVVRIQGDPGRPFALFYSPVEEMTFLPDGTMLFIDPSSQIAAGVEIAGVLDAAGQGFYLFPVLKRHAGTKLSFQAVSPTPFLQVSNVCRATFQKVNTFAIAAGSEASPSFLGDAFPMADGRLLSIGGSGSMVEAYDPCLQQLDAVGWIDPAPAHSARAMLANGKVLLAGGLAADGSAVADAVLFDPKLGDVVSVGPMLAPRAGASAVRLADGRVLIAGGLASSDLSDPQAFASGIQSSTEIFDPEAWAFVPGPAMPEAKAFATATLLGDGSVLVAGGLSAGGGEPCVSADACVLDGAAASFGSPVSIASPRLFHTATTLADGSVLLGGGLMPQLKKGAAPFPQALLAPVLTSAVYSPVSGACAPGPKLLARRGMHSAAVVGSHVLLMGGVGSPIDLASVLAGTQPAERRKSSELVGVGEVSLQGPGMRVGRAGAAAAVSPMDGRVIVIGGGPLKPALYQP